MLFFVINSYCKPKPACCDLPCSAILLKAAGTAGEQEGFCELCPIGVQGEPPIFCSAAHCLSCTCSLCFCNVLSKLGCNLETGRMCFGCAQNQEFQNFLKIWQRSESFPAEQMERTAPIAVRCVWWGTSELTHALFSLGVPVCVSRRCLLCMAQIIQV